MQNSSRISTLNPQLVRGILYVGGWLKNAVVADGRKDPYILDHRHLFIKIVVAHYHLKYLNAGQ